MPTSRPAGYTPRVDLIVNGEPRRVENVATVQDLLRELGVDARQVAVEVNLEVVPRARHAFHPLRGGERVEIVSFVGGG